MERRRYTEVRRPVLTRMGNWLKGVVSKEQHADPQWEEEVERKKSGKMGEDIRLPEDMRAVRR